MPDLFFHIGLPKCASTTIQRKVLGSVPGYLGTGAALQAPENFAKQFQALAPVGPRLRGSISAARDWAERVLEYGQTLDLEMDRYIASSELLSNRNKLNPRPIVPFLRHFSDEVWTAGEVKVLLVLRNPADRIASSYAQNSSSTHGASQQHFEAHVERVLNRSFSTFDLAAWVDDLYQTMGQENVCVLLMEDIGTPRFWEDLKDFMRLEEFEPASMLNTQGMNSRKSDPNRWRLSEFSPMDKAKSQSGKLLGLVWPAGRLPGLRRNVRSALNQAIAGWHRINPARKRARDTHIELTDDLRSRIQSHCRPVHERLATLLERDLSKLGY